MELVNARTRALMDGHVFCSGYLFPAVAANATVQVHIVGGATPALLDVNVVSDGKATIQPYRGTTYSAPGTPLSMSNRKLASPNVASTAAFRTPTVNVLGTACAPTLVEGGSGRGKAGAEGSDDFGFMLSEGGDVLISVTNTSGTASDINVQIFTTELA